MRKKSTKQKPAVRAGDTKAKPADAAAEEGSGIIDANKAYTVNAFCKTLGIHRKGSAYQRLRRDGLPIIGGRYIRGQDFIDLLGRMLEAEQREAEKPAGLTRRASEKNQQRRGPGFEPASPRGTADPEGPVH